jgi:hypothetical protein
MYSLASIRIELFFRVQLCPEANVGLGAAHSGTKAKQEQLVCFGILGTQLIAGISNQSFAGDSVWHPELHRAGPLEIQRLEPIRITFAELTVTHLEPWNLYPEVGLVDDLLAEQTFRSTQPTVERPIHFEFASRIAASASQTMPSIEFTSALYSPAEQTPEKAERRGPEKPVREVIAFDSVGFKDRCPVDFCVIGLANEDRLSAACVLPLGEAVVDCACDIEVGDPAVHERDTADDRTEGNHR